MSISRLIGTMASPSPSDPSPPQLTGTPLTRFSDVRTDWFSFSGFSYDITMNRYQPRVATGGTELYHRQPIDATVPPWEPYTSGGGIFEINTIHGPAFKMICTAEMWQTGGPGTGKLAQIHDVNHHIPFASIPLTQEWTGKFMMPSAGSPTGIPAAWNAGVFAEFHTASASGHHWGLDGTSFAQPRLRWGRHTGLGNSYEFIWSPQAFQFDHWYEWRMFIKWGYDGTAFLEANIDNEINFVRSGATLFGSEVPNVYIGYYADEQKTNEVHHAAIQYV